MGWVLFFDGDCGFCSRAVRCVHRLDGRGRIDFAPLQGELAREKGFGRFAEPGGGTLVLYREEDGRVFQKSSAVAELGCALGGIWAFLGRLLSMLPRGWRDWCYGEIARRRHLLGGGADACGVPGEGLRERMRD